VLAREKQPDYETVVCDFEKEDIPKSALELIDMVFHIAGFSHDMSYSDEIEDPYHKVNLNATLQLAESLRIFDLARKMIRLSGLKVKDKLVILRFYLLG
jgi:nucleoside-diphosphate-sugar epimerase